MAMSMPSMPEVSDGYSVVRHETFLCAHCGKRFPVEQPTIYVAHVPDCLEAHVSELRAHNLVARPDDTYINARQVGSKRIDYAPRATVGWVK